MSADTPASSNRVASFVDAIGGGLLFLAIVGFFLVMPCVGAYHLWQAYVAPKHLPPPAVSLEAHDAAVALLQGRIDALEARSSSIASDVLLLRIEHAERVEFSPASTGYQTLTTSSGIFLVALEKVDPYANGHRLTFAIGNPQAIAYGGVQFEVKWGEPRPRAAETGEDYGATHAAWLRSLRQKSETSLKEIRPGSWNRITITVAPATAAEVGHVQLSMTIGNVSMARR